MAELQQKIQDIEAATAAGQLFKEQLSVILLRTVDLNSQAVHTPLRKLGVTPGRNIAQEFDKAEDDSAQEMMKTVRAVGEFCSDRKVETLSAVQTQLESTTHQLAFICTGVDWNKMIAEAQGVVKKDAQEIVDILVEEQKSVNADNHVPAQSSLTLREAHGEPNGLRHAVALYGGEDGTFANTYVQPGWAVEEKDGSVAVIGNMLMLYQELGKAFEVTSKNWAQAQKAALDLDLQVQAAMKDLAEHTQMLKLAIAKKVIAKSKMKEAKGLVVDAEKVKLALESTVLLAKKVRDKGKQAFQKVKNVFMSAFKKRNVALLELSQELQEKGK